MTEVIEQTGLLPVIVVLGAHASSLLSTCQGKNSIIVINEIWQEGMASSIRCGIHALQKNYPACDGALIMVCDQPFITTTLLDSLVTIQKQSLKPIAACQYDNTTGTPAVFHKTIFPELLSLQGDKGAGKILQQRPGMVATLDFPMGQFDIDTTEDYEALQKKASG